MAGGDDEPYLAGADDVTTVADDAAEIDTMTTHGVNEWETDDVATPSHGGTVAATMRPSQPDIMISGP